MTGMVSGAAPGVAGCWMPGAASELWEGFNLGGSLGRVWR